MAVTVSGSVLSSLFLEQINSPGDQEGFILGEVQCHVTSRISDTQMESVKEETHTSIYSFLPCSKSFSFYNRAGIVDSDKLQKVLQGKQKEVIGWYKFRRNSSMNVSMRERAIHASLHQQFQNVSQRHFVFCLFTSCTTANLSTHSFDNTLMYMCGRQFYPIPLTVVNLGDTSHTNYRVRNSSMVKHSDGMFSNLISQFESAFVERDGNLGQTWKVEEMTSVLQEKLQGLCANVAESEREMNDIYSEVFSLREKLKQKLLEEESQTQALATLKRAQKPLPPEPVETIVENLVDLEEEPVARRPHKTLTDNKESSQIYELEEIFDNILVHKEKMRDKELDEIFDSIDNQLGSSEDSAVAMETGDAVAMETGESMEYSDVNDLKMEEGQNKCDEEKEKETKQEIAKTEIPSKPADAFSFVEDMLKMTSSTKAKNTVGKQLSKTKNSDKTEDEKLDKSKNVKTTYTTKIDATQEEAPAKRLTRQEAKKQSIKSEHIPPSVDKIAKDHKDASSDKTNEKQSTAKPARNKNEDVVDLTKSSENKQSHDCLESVSNGDTTEDMDNGTSESDMPPSPVY